MRRIEPTTSSIFLTGTAIRACARLFLLGALLLAVVRGDLLRAGSVAPYRARLVFA